MEMVKASDFIMMDNNYTPVSYEGVEFSVLNTITFDDMEDIVFRTVEACFVGENGAYTPEIKDFMFKIEIIKKYTNIEVPDDPRDQYMFIYLTDIFDIVLENANSMQIRSIGAAINERVSSLVQANVGVINARFAELETLINSFSDNVQKSMGNINQEAVANMINAFSTNSIDEVKLARAIMKIKNEE